MSVRLGINGFGRIGRYLTRLISQHKSEFEIAAVNARASNQDLAHLLKYDSAHGRIPGEVYPSDKDHDR